MNISTLRKTKKAEELISQKNLSLYVFLHSIWFDLQVFRDIVADFDGMAQKVRLVITPNVCAAQTFACFQINKVSIGWYVFLISRFYNFFISLNEFQNVQDKLQ